MSKSKVPKNSYDANWDIHARDLGTLPAMGRDDWKAILSQRKFREGTEPEVKLKIAQAVLAFVRMNTGYNNLDEYKDTLVELRKELIITRDKVYALDKFNYQRLLAIGPILDVDDGYEHLVLGENPLKEFCHTATALAESIQRTIAGIGKRRPGPATDDVYWLVRALNKIVLQFSDGGRITRSTKTRSGVGNDRGFVDSVIDVARRESGRSINRWTIDAAIRKLKQ